MKPMTKPPYSSRQLGRELTDTERLYNLWWHHNHCWECGHFIGWQAAVCEHCGEELLENAKH